MLIKIILLTSLMLSALYSSVIHVNEKSINISVLENSYMYIDESSTLNFKDIQKKDFKPFLVDYVRLGYIDATLWTKFSIKNDSPQDMTRYISISNPTFDTVELYTKIQKKYKKESQGLWHLNQYKRNNILHPSFKVEFKAHEMKEFYYKTHSIDSAHYFKLHIKDINTLYEDEFSYQLILSMFFGAMLALVLYNVFIYFFTRELSYLYYILYILFTTLYYASYSIMLDYILPENSNMIDIFMDFYSLALANIAALLFIKVFLNIKQYKRHNIIINMILVLNIMHILIYINGSYLIEYSLYIILVTFVFILYISAFSFYKKNPQAKYILIGWSFNFSGVLMISLQQYGLPNIIDYFPHFCALTIFMEAILFSVALSSKLNTTKALQKAVKTNKILTRELHHRVKNNMQFIILMYRLKLDSLNNKDVEQKLRESEGAVQAISKTHEILYNQNDLENIDTQGYFTNLIDELEKSFNTTKIKIYLEVKDTLDVQNSIHCGIILNELITNSFKYAFKDGEGVISIKLIKKDKKHIFTVEDNGEGFDYEQKQHDSFGLSFVETIVVDELGGTILFDTSDGTKVKMNF
ncbi:7TM diverse intracellular signaling domain-containing protein [Sulfurimonas sp.]|uniref:7TM diverse intracellular signaling domain-containing protein n=2 Tax=Sulfurimonas sp. TaxID=2022749 RepID=UPI002B470D18|nr:7TM diverse intracellular signaling domain-containing protein [Sulfurimonas sp.]